MSLVAEPEPSMLLLGNTCACPGHRRLPIRLLPEAIFTLREALQRANVSFSPETVIQTYKCPSCRAMVEMTARDLFLT